MTGIYKIENLKNNKVYIGETIDHKRRIWKHQSLLRKNTHPNRKLQNSWNLHGEENFVFELLEECEPEELMEKELEYIDKYDSVRGGYNIVRGRRFDIEWTRKERAENPLAWNPNRIRTETEVLFIKSLQYVFGSISRPLAKIFNTTSSSINYYYNNTRYVEVCKKFNDSTPLEKAHWFSQALQHTDFSLSLVGQFNEEVAKLIWALTEEFGFDRNSMAKLMNRSVSGMEKIYYKDSFPNSQENMRKWTKEERELKMFLFIIYLDFQGQSAAKSLVEWSETFNDYLEREYTISD